MPLIVASDEPAGLSIEESQMKKSMTPLLAVCCGRRRGPAPAPERR
jgi:hypothetical protein